MDYKASEFLMESMKDLFADRIKLSPELTETIKPETAPVDGKADGIANVIINESTEAANITPHI